MKKNKISILVLIAVLTVGMVGCNTSDKNTKKMTQTRLYNNKAGNQSSDWMNRDARNRLNTNLNNGMVRDNTYLNNGSSDMYDNNNLDTGIRPNTLDNNNMNMNMNMTNLSNRANIIAKRIIALPEINSASVVIHGDRAVVGLEPMDGKNYTNDKTQSSINQKVEAAVKAADRNIKTVSITSDPTLYSRIKGMSTKITNGNPISTFVRDIEDVIRSITAPITAPMR